MSVLVIRANKRFAVCRKARLGHAEGAEDDGLLIELSLDGCRIGNVESKDFTTGEMVKVEVDGADPFAGEVRWQGDRAIGLKFTCPFHVPELDRLIRLCRGEDIGDARLRA